MSGTDTSHRQYGERAEVQSHTVTDTLKKTPFEGIGKQLVNKY